MNCSFADREFVLKGHQYNTEQCICVQIQCLVFFHLSTACLWTSFFGLFTLLMQFRFALCPGCVFKTPHLKCNCLENCFPAMFQATPSCANCGCAIVVFVINNFCKTELSQFWIIMTIIIITFCAYFWVLTHIRCPSCVIRFNSVIRIVHQVQSLFFITLFVLHFTAQRNAIQFKTRKYFTV